MTAGDVALVLEGGGMRAAWSSGVLNVLLEHDVHTGWVGGISAGSTCTVNWLVRDRERTRRAFTDFAAERDFGGWGSWARGRGYFNSEWIYERSSLPGEVLPLDFDAVQANPAPFAIGGFRATDGAMVYWGREDIQEPLDLLRRVRASSTMPLRMPWTVIDGEVYCDGALGPTGGYPIDAAKTAGFRRFLVVTTRTRDYVKGPQRAQRAMRAALRRYPAVAEGLFARPANYNRTREELFDLERDGHALVLSPDRMPITNAERNVARLTDVYLQGVAQTRRDLPRILDFLGA